MRPDHIKGLKNGVLRHPFEITICIITVLSIYNLIRILIDRPEVLANSSHGLLRMPALVLWIWCISGIIGSLLMLTGLTMSAFSARGMDLEAMGLFLSMVLWLSTFVVTAVAQPTAFQTYGQYLAIAAGCIVRLVAIDHMRNVVLSISEDPDG